MTPCNHLSHTRYDHTQPSSKPSLCGTPLQALKALYTQTNIEWPEDANETGPWWLKEQYGVPMKGQVTGSLPIVTFYHLADHHTLSPRHTEV